MTWGGSAQMHENWRLYAIRAWQWIYAESIATGDAQRAERVKQYLERDLHAPLAPAIVAEDLPGGQQRMMF